MSAFHDVILAGASGSQGYQISRSVRLRSSASAYFNRTQAAPTSSQKSTWSMWLKLGKRNTLYDTIYAGSAGSAASGDLFGFLNNSGGQFRIFFQGGTGGDLVTTQLFRDPSAWYHIVVAVDTTQATSSNRVKIYVNGAQVTAFSTATYPALNYSMTQFFANGNVNRIGYNPDTSEYFDGYITEFNAIDGQQLTPSSFGETDTITGVWKPKKYAGTYGTNGFYLNFSDNSNNTAATIGKDSSGNGNNWTPNNISVTSGVTYDSMLDTPTPYADGGNGRGNYAVLNPLDSGATISDGNITFSGPTGNATTRATIGITSGKWYWEVTPNAVPGGLLVGIANSSASLSQYLGQNANGWSYCGDGNKYTNASGSAYGATYTTNDVIGVAFDADAGTLVFYKNNSSQGTAFSSLTSGPYFPAIGDGASSSVVSAWANFGQRPFTYTPPTGFKALNTQNLPTPTITNGANYMAATLYTGNATARSITGVGFQPDFVWTKSRSGAESHRLYDAVRGATKSLYSNLTNAEATEAQSLTAFNSDGFSLGTGAPNSNAVTYAAWQWQAGQGTTSSNTSGSITSTVSVNTTAGFSVATWVMPASVNSTVGHGLGVAPSLVILKSRAVASGWATYHRSLGAGSYVSLNATTAATVDANAWNNTAPTSSVFSIGSSFNGLAGNYVAYCWAEVAGFSKFGSYTGNGSTDGPFVYCGFRPRWIMIKSSTDGTVGWLQYDSSRNTYNVTDLNLRANTSDAEGTQAANYLDFVSNGVKIRGTNTGSINLSGATYIFAAFAENPMKYSLAR